jgi:hypothetical protein
MKNRNILLTATLFSLGALALSPAPNAFGVIPAPDGGYPGGNTAEGQSALLSLTTGINNTAVGWMSLRSVTTGQLNTAVGAGALSANAGNLNTATGGAALFSNNSGFQNTASGALALFHNTTGSNNNAFGFQALFSTTTGPFNNAFGNGALASNTTGDRNTAMGEGALLANTIGFQNTAVGVSALRNNTTGRVNIAIGQDACHDSGNASFNIGVGWSVLFHNTADGNIAIGAAALSNNTTGSGNIAIGGDALANNATGNGNIALGDNAGQNIDGNGNIAIGNPGTAGEGSTIRIGTDSHLRTYIGGIAGAQVAGTAVFIAPNGQLGNIGSSRRFKKDIQPMKQTSEGILALKPVTFHYKSDATNSPQFGLIAEEVAEVNADLVVRDKEGQPYSVRYDQVNAMLLNEFLKEHRKVQEVKRASVKQEATIVQQRNDFEATIARLDATIAQQQKELKAISASVKEQALRLQKVTTRVATGRVRPADGLELSKGSPRTVLNDQ